MLIWKFIIFIILLLVLHNMVWLSVVQSPVYVQCEYKVQCSLSISLKDSV